MRKLVTSTIKIFLILVSLFITACGGSDSPTPAEPETSSTWGEMKWGEGTWGK